MSERTSQEILKQITAVIALREHIDHAIALAAEHIGQESAWRVLHAADVELTAKLDYLADLLPEGHPTRRTVRDFISDWERRNGQS